MIGHQEGLASQTSSSASQCRRGHGRLRPAPVFQPSEDSGTQSGAGDVVLSPLALTDSGPGNGPAGESDNSVCWLLTESD